MVAHDKIVCVDVSSFIRLHDLFVVTYRHTFFIKKMWTIL